MNITDKQVAVLMTINTRLQEAQRRRYFDLLEIDPCADALLEVLTELGVEPASWSKVDWSKIVTVVR